MKGNSDAAGARRPPASDKPPMSMNGLLRCQAKLTQPKAGVAACLAMIPSVYNGTSCPATAASNGGSSERSSEGLDSRWALPGAGSFNRPTVREVVSNRTEQKNFKKYNEGRSISGYSNMLPTKTGSAFSALRQKYGDRPLLSLFGRPAIDFSLIFFIFQ